MEHCWKVRVHRALVVGGRSGHREEIRLPEKAGQTQNQNTSYSSVFIIIRAPVLSYRMREQSGEGVVSVVQFSS